MVLQGVDLIFIIFFGYMDLIINVVKKFLNVKFEYVIGYKIVDNVFVYFVCFYEGCVVQGYIVGKMIKINIVGYIVFFLILEVICGINFVYIYVKCVNLDVEFKIIWVYIWFDLVKEVDVVKVLIE